MDKLNILAILPESIGGRLTTSSIIDGFVQLGHSVGIYDVLKDSEEKLIEMRSGKIDFVLSYDFTAIKHKINYNLVFPTINYFSDVIEDSHSGADWENYYQYLKEDDNYTFYWDKKLTEMKKDEIKNIFYMPHFVNTKVYKNLNLKTEYDLMFAGRLDTDFRLETVLYLMKKFEHLNFAWFAIKKHYEDALSRVKSQKDAGLIQRNYRGFIDTEEKMAEEINKTKIVFNFNAQAIGALNYRTFQVIACEKLLLSDCREEAKELFSIGENFVCFDTVADLEEKINYYLNNENEYKKITEAGRKIVEKNYSSNVCVDKMLKSIL